MTCPDLGRPHLSRIATPSYRDAADAFLQLNIRRLVPPADQDAHSVLLEMTFLNQPAPATTPIDHTLVFTPTALSWTRLRQVRQAFCHRTTLSTAEAQDLDTILRLLPPPWRSVLTAADIPGAPFAAITAPGVRPTVFQGPTTENGLPTTRLWLLSPNSGLLVPFADAAFARDPSVPPRPALVTWKKKPKTAWLRADYEFAEDQRQLPPSHRKDILEPWLVGFWEDLALDPRVWGLIHPATGHRTTLLDLDVKTARRRLLRASARSWNLPGYNQHGVVWPALWPHPRAPTITALTDAPDHALSRLGLRGLEEKWRRSATAPLAAPEDDTFADYVDAAYVDRAPPWLSLAGPSAAQTSARDLRAGTRAEARDRLQALPPLLPAPPLPTLTTPPPDNAAHNTDLVFPWSRLLDPTLPRPYALTAWRLLHGQLGCQAFLHHVRRQVPALAATPCSPFCYSPACAPSDRLETLSHVFLECPDFAPATDWLCNTWGALTGGAAPPRTAEVLLADDLRSWTTNSPAHSSRLLALWNRLRVAVIGSIWRVRCLRDQGPLSSTPARLAIKMAIDLIHEAINRDWLRTTTDIRHLDNGYFCTDWWRGQDPTFSFDDFVELWATPPLLCDASAGDPEADPVVPPSLSLLLHLTFPLSLPP